jgi:hypothetical protein
MVTPAAKREAVAHLRTLFEVSERRACKVLEADRTSVRYRGQRADDAIVRARLRELAAIRRRFGYRRLLVLMRREGLVMNHEKFRRLYREEPASLSPWWAQTGTWHQGAASDPAGSRPSLEPRFSVRCLRRWPTFPHLTAWKDDYNNAPQCPGQHHTDRIRQSQRSRAATGRAAPCRGLRARPRCSTEPLGLKYHRDSK